MPTIVIHLAAALACWAGQCHPALVGRPGHQTPTGVYRAVLRTTNEPGYGGRVFVFAERGDVRYSIHQTWALHPDERRKWRLAYGTPDQRHISMGCVNVAPWLFDQLADRSTVWRVRIEE